ncbi:hypothetical protein VNO78_22992 [Psophocarpus tetragonolobus]|uniref:Uncharacterized protein n=1 Tax=Psophocarpus tetragonolobus TaxID=3891 RepID=A0AAN9XCP5_PSOTE
MERDWQNVTRATWQRDDAWHSKNQRVMGIGAAASLNAYIYIYPLLLIYIPFTFHMDWWHKVTKTWTTLSTRIKHHRKSRVSSAPLSGECGRPTAGLLNLRHDVQMCGYRDVEVMWDMLNVCLQHHQMEAAITSNNAPLHNHTSISRLFFFRE